LPLCLPGAAIGIWGLVVLFDDEVRDAFRGVQPTAATASVAKVVSAASPPWAPPTSVPPPPPQDRFPPPPPPA
jgi:hypothetical protein